MMTEAPELAKEHQKYFAAKGIQKVTENVYLAFGYGVANVVILVGANSLVLVDTTEKTEVAATILKDLRKITDKPISDVIYTHHHGDHAGGLPGFTEDADHPPTVWAHETLKELFWYSDVWPRALAGVNYQFGLPVTKKEPGKLVNQGLGPDVDMSMWTTGQTDKQAGGRYFPNKFVSGKRNDVTIAGIPLSLLHLPGETKDHLVVWWEEAGVLCPGDNIYRCFPSLYPIRGTPERNALVWARSLEEMAELRPRFLCPSHSGAVQGEAELAQIFRVYTDAIYFVHDQTLRFINRGMHPIEVARNVSLPPSMASHPYLQEHYGKLEWIVRNIYITYFGWFSGSDLLELSPYLPEERSQKLVDLVGKEKLVSAAEEAMDAGDTWWAVELTTHVVRKEDDQKAWKIRENALESLAKLQISSHARNTYKTFAQPNWNFKEQTIAIRKDVLYRPSPDIFRALKWNVIPENADVISDVLQLDLTDETDGVYYLYFSHAVLMYVRGEAGETSSIKFTGDIQAFREYVWGVRDPLKINDDVDVKLEGDKEKFSNFLACFDKFSSNI